MKINYYTISEIGSRQNNDDKVFCLSHNNNKHIFALADGLGGHGLGYEASEEVCTAINEYFTTNTVLSNDMFDELFSLCQKRLYEKQINMNARKKMRTTLNLVCIDSETLYWSHIGDTRTYYFDNKRIIKRTIDHSVPQVLALIGEITEDQIRFHEDRNHVLKVLGVEDQMPPPYEVEESIPIKGNQQILLCSDGFWEYITEDKMTSMLELSSSPEEWAQSMMSYVKEAADIHRDDMSAICIWIEN